MSAIWRGSPCRWSSDDANTDWVHCLSPRCTVKWQTELPAISSQRRRDVGCATATVATDANVVTMSPDVALLAGLSFRPLARSSIVLISWVSQLWRALKPCWKNTNIWCQSTWFIIEWQCVLIFCNWRKLMTPAYSLRLSAGHLS